MAEQLSLLAQAPQQDLPGCKKAGSQWDVHPGSHGLQLLHCRRLERAVNDSNYLTQIKTGRNLTMRNYTRLMEWMDANMPACERQKTGS